MYKLRHRNLSIALTTILSIVLVGFCLGAIQIFFHGCLWWECAPKRAFTVYDLNLPDLFFPSSADTHSLRFLREDNSALEAASTANYWDSGLAIYIVRRFATYSQASRQYNFDANYRFTRPLNDPKLYSSLIDYKSLVAEESKVLCGYVLDDLRCVFIARYKEFTIFFSGSVGDHEMSQSDFLGLTNYLDSTMAILLEREP